MSRKIILIWAPLLRVVGESVGCRVPAGRGLRPRSHPAVAGVAPPQAQVVGPSLQLSESVLGHEARGRHGHRITDPAERGIHAAAGLELRRGGIVRHTALGNADSYDREPTHVVVQD